VANVVAAPAIRSHVHPRRKVDRRQRPVRELVGPAKLRDDMCDLGRPEAVQQLERTLDDIVLISHAAVRIGAARARARELDRASGRRTRLR